MNNFSELFLLLSTDIPTFYEYAPTIRICGTENLAQR